MSPSKTGGPIAAYESYTLKCRHHGDIEPVQEYDPFMLSIRLRCPECIKEEELLNEDKSDTRPTDADVEGEIPQHEAGAKLDTGKPDASLLQLFPRALLEVARVGTFGAAKYTRGGFLSVPNGVVRYTAAMLRHFFSEQTEGTYDQDASCEEYGYKDQVRHDAQVAWNALARLEMQLIEESANEPEEK